MTLSHSAANTVLKSVTDRLAEEFPGLHIMFIASQPGKRLAEFNLKKGEISEHPAGAILLPHLESVANSANPYENYHGIAIAPGKSSLLLRKKEQALACIFIELTGDIETEIDVQFVAYTHICRILMVMEAPPVNPALLKRKHGELIQPSPNPESEALTNLLADCFAVFVLRLHGHQNAFNRFGRLRARKALEAEAYYDAENYPLATALEIVKLIYKSRRAQIEKKKNFDATIFTSAAALATEMTAAYDFKNIESWKALCAAAQEMAWAGTNAKKILGTVIYSCEDPFIRSDAYMIAELLNTDPVPITYFDFYNPFTDEEVNERRHKKLCRHHFDTLTLNTEAPDLPLRMVEKATQLNRIFVEGEILGWCAPAFREAAKSCEDGNTDAAEDIFMKCVDEIPWHTIQTAGTHLLNLRRNGEKISLKKAADILKENPDWAQVAGGLLQ